MLFIFNILIHFNIRNRPQTGSNNITTSPSSPKSGSDSAGAMKKYLQEIEEKFDGLFEAKLEQKVNEYKLKLKQKFDSKVEEKINEKLELNQTSVSKEEYVLLQNQIVDLQRQFEEYKAKTDSEIAVMKQDYEGKSEEVDSLKEQNQTYSDKLKTATKDIQDLIVSKNFLTQETEKIKTLKQHVETSQIKMSKSMLELQSRANHAEDHSRRDNLLFFGIEESETFESSGECETKIRQTMADLHQEGDYEVEFDRVHRLGKKKTDSQTGKVITRPIIAKFTQHKDKELILERIRALGKAQKGLTTGKKVFKISEDFCKTTQSIRKELLQKLKEGKENNVDIKGGFLRYKTLTVIFNVEDTNVYKNYSLQYIKENRTTCFKTPTMRDLY